jgi:hypothetical protein
VALGETTRARGGRLHWTFPPTRVEEQLQEEEAEAEAEGRGGARERERLEREREEGRQ